MLFVVALRHFGATGAAMIWRSGLRGEVVRLGDSSRADLRLAGAGAAAAELLSDGAAWRLRRPDGSVRRVRDGDTVTYGPWIVVLLLAEEPDATAEAPPPEDLLGGDADAGLPRFSAEGGEPSYVRDRMPALLGAAPWCALRVEAVGLPVAAVVRRDGAGATVVYPIPGVDLRRDGERVTMPTRLRDADALRAGGAGAPVMRFADPQEELDRLLGTVVLESPSRTPPPRLGRGDDAFVTLAEAALWAVGAAVALAYAGLVWSRW